MILAEIEDSVFAGMQSNNMSFIINKHITGTLSPAEPVTQLWIYAIILKIPRYDGNYLTNYPRIPLLPLVYH